MKRGAAVAHGSTCYFSRLGGGCSVFDSENDDWSELPECPQKDFGLAVIDNLPTAVGGMVQSGGGCINCLSSFNGSEWVKNFPPTPTKRVFHTVISVQNYLIAAGGVKWGNTFSTVEVMDMNTLEWSTAASLPEPVYDMTATVCGGRLYLLGGKDKKHNSTRVVFTCTLDSLIHSCHPPSQTPPHTNEDGVWQRVADVPVRGSTCATLKGRVLAVGGMDSDGNPTAAVHLYDAKSDSWPLVGYMPTARDCCLVVALHNRIIAVGGGDSRDERSCCTVECGVVADVEVEHLTVSGIEERTFDRRKGKGFVLHVPKGAVSSGDCTFDVKPRVVSQSTREFKFPEGSKLVSGVYHITASRKLSQPVFLKMQHCAVIKGDSQHTQIEVATADSTTGPPYHFKPYRGGTVRVTDSYVEVELAHFCFLSCFLRTNEEPATIRYSGLVFCLKTSELTLEYRIVVIRDQELCIEPIKQMYAKAEIVDELRVKFKGEALTLQNVSVKGTTSGGWHVRTKWDPAMIEEKDADEFTPGTSVLPSCCVLASVKTKTPNVGALKYMLKFSGTQQPKTYLLHRDALSARTTSISSVDEAPTTETDVSGVDDSLDERDLHSILEATVEVAANWERIGDALHLSPGTLKNIRADNPAAEERLREVILKWLQKSGNDHIKYGPPTWRWLVKAVGDRAGGDNPELANTIASQHIEGSDVAQAPPATPGHTKCVIF